MSGGHPQPQLAEPRVPAKKASSISPYRQSVPCSLPQLPNWLALFAGPVRQQSRYPLSPDERQAAASPSGRDAPSEPRLPSEKRGSIMSRTQDLRNSEGRRPSMGMTYAEMGERRDSINKEALAAAELYGAFDR